ncbi:hypothetical protein AB6A40_002653 [Gnathostoma spinigerum]|uniref:Trimethylguanosine synthase n=1 Tax=Gnathostoma spinigerum TaxID=75299 RepID=A0ABD6E770_9BILA
MDREGWFSVTPERVAEHIADRMVRKKDTVIVDAFAGVGGNSIQMALRGAFVIAIDLDPVKLKCAAHNAHVYGVQDRISFVCIDFFHFVRSVATESAQLTGVCTQHPFDAVFLSPPWGGPSYLLLDEFDLKNDLRPDGFKIFEAAQSLSPNIAYFLPRNTVISQIISLAGSGRSCEIEQNTLNKKLKAITAYYGDLIAQS